MNSKKIANFAFVNTIVCILYTLFGISNFAQTEVSRFPEGPTVNFDGISVFDYYYGYFVYWWNLAVAWFKDNSWQVQLSFALIFLCIVTMIILSVLFYRNIREVNRFEKNVQWVNDNLREHFYNILISIEQPTMEEVEKECNMTVEKMREIPPKVMATAISSLRMELSELTVLPNTQLLCDITGVTQYLETNLIAKRDVMETLQNLVNLHLRVSEGLLAIYINHYNSNLRQMARMSYMICTETEPYRYLEEDLQEKQALWRPMMLHRLFGWLRDTERQMPQFLVLANVMQDESTASFLIEEIAYWGSEEEKSQLKQFFVSKMFKCRESALKAVALLGDESQEQAIVESYTHQPEYLRRSCLRAIHAINSGRNTEFFVDAYYRTSSKETKECALTCLYSYGEDGRSRFEQMHVDMISDQQGLNLLNQIDSMALLQQMRMF
ncbi:MAG: hypothetical protein KBT29_10735 [Prevotellaceae bacterium]|nr:hypothetical protein [Candidatus Minthosoma caballi]